MSDNGKQEKERMTLEMVEDFLADLDAKGRGKSSIGEYRRVLNGLYEYLPANKLLGKHTGEKWRDWLLEKQKLSVRTVNLRMSILNSFLEYLGHRDWYTRSAAVEEKEVLPELTRAEYLRLLSAARQQNKEKTYLLIKTLGGAGVRVQELPQVTVEAARRGLVRLDSHNSARSRILRIPKILQEEMLSFIEKEGMDKGSIFVSSDGSPLSRSAVHRQVSSVSREAKVDAEKANPRCLWKMYQATYDGIRANIDALVDQSYERLLEEEQLMLGKNDAC